MMTGREKSIDLYFKSIMVFEVKKMNTHKSRNLRNSMELSEIAVESGRSSLLMKGDSSRV